MGHCIKSFAEVHKTAVHLFAFVNALFNERSQNVQVIRGAEIFPKTSLSPGT
jgi:hypothetical protein